MKLKKQYIHKKLFMFVCVCCYSGCQCCFKILQVSICLNIFALVMRILPLANERVGDFVVKYGWVWLQAFFISFSAAIYSLKTSIYSRDSKNNF